MKNETELLQECKLQLEYLNEKFGETGTTNALLTKLDAVLRQPLVSGMLLSDYAKKKLEYINEHCIARYFPNNQPTLEWAGAVLDLLEELKLGNYR